MRDTRSTDCLTRFEGKPLYCYEKTELITIICILIEKLIEEAKSD